MSSLDLTRDWLRNVLKPYPARDLIQSQIMDILQHRRTLSVKTDAFTFDTGHTALLLLLHGTLPIDYRGTTYQIPVHVWIPHEYPRSPPLAFVVPTKEMGVRKGREVDPGGRVVEDVVSRWWQRWQDKSVEMLLRQLAEVFSKSPPVFARPTQPSTAQRPTQISRASSGDQGPAAGPSQPPPTPARPSHLPPGVEPENLPQYRAAPTPPPHPYPLQHSRSPSQHLGGQSPTASPISPTGTLSPPVPTRPGQLPPRHSSQPPPHPSAGPPPPQRPYIPAPASGPQHGQNVYPTTFQSPQAPLQNQYPNQYPAQQSHSRHPSIQSDPIPQGEHYHPDGYSSPPPPQPAHPVATQHPQSTVQSRQPVQDLMSSPERSTSSLLESTTSPPPVPPSKPPPPSLLHLHSILLPHINASLPPLLHSLQSNRKHLLDRHEDLVSGEPAIRDEMARLEAVKKVCDSVGRKMDEVVAKGEERVIELEGRGEVSVDEVVCGISIAHNQLIDLVAEDNAIEDTIYHMTRALDSERVDLDRFLKSIRSLAREQYMKRALIERILHGMGQKQGW